MFDRIIAWFRGLPVEVAELAPIAERADSLEVGGAPSPFKKKHDEGGSFFAQSAMLAEEREISYTLFRDIKGLPLPTDVSRPAAASASNSADLTIPLYATAVMAGVTSGGAATGLLFAFVPDKCAIVKDVWPAIVIGAIVALAVALVIMHCESPAEGHDDMSAEAAPKGQIGGSTPSYDGT